MKLILKNSTILFQNKNYVEVPTTSVLNTPTSFYVDSSAIKAGGQGFGTNLYVNVYQVTAGTTYYVRSLPDKVLPNPNSILTAGVSITFGTNLLSSTGQISNANVLKTYSVFDTELSDFSIEFTPSQNGYIYITEVDYGSDQYPAICLSSVFV